MLKPSRSHQEFQEFLTEQIKLHYLEKGYVGTILLYYRELTRVWFTDLTEVSSIIRFRYSLRRGAPARDPIDMFRSLLLMEMTHCNSVDDWVKELKAFPLQAIFSGFPPDNVPGVGTFYDFIRRLWLASSPHLSKKVRKRKRKPKKGKKKGEHTHRDLKLVPMTSCSGFLKNVLCCLPLSWGFWEILNTSVLPEMGLPSVPVPAGTEK